ncbi:MAG: rod shape-determining protein RodA [bacterium]|nr:rod shape-determining protein RodA [bacterium]
MWKQQFAEHIDYPTVIIVALLVCIGLAMIYSTTHTLKSPYTYFNKQLLWVILAVLWLIIITGIDYNFFYRYAWYFYLLNILLLLAVFITGHRAMGAVRWLNILGLKFQPSELSKIIIIFALGSYLSTIGENIKQVKFIIGALIIVGIPMGLIVKQPDLGTAMVLVPILFVMLFLAGARIKHLVSIIGIGILASPFLYMTLKEYQKKRLLVFLDPESDPLGAGYNIIQSKIAIGSGGLFGKGWLQGTQTQLEFIPEHHTDFIFSAFAEEFGFCGAIVLIILYGLLLYRLFSWIKLIEDKQGMLAIAGLATLLTAHIFINIGMTIGIMPVTGLPLPFISYGGTALLTFATAVGLAMNIHKRSV